MDTNNTILRVLGLKKYFPLNPNFFGKPQSFLRAVDDITFDLPKGKTIGVVGESGCGKTTLGRTILKLYEATDGRVLYNGRDINLYQPSYYVKEIKKLTSYHEKLKNCENEEEYIKLKEKASKSLGGLPLLDNASEIQEMMLNLLKHLKNNEQFEADEIKNKLDEIKKENSVNLEFVEMENNKDVGIDLAKLTNKEMRPLRVDIQLVFQDPYSSLPPRMTVGSIISEAVKVHKIVPKDQIHEHVLTIMEKCGLQRSYYDRYPHEFSGGQRQRICIARALAVNPKLVVCDEPVSALDVSIQAQIINLLKELQNNLGLTYIFISHDLSVVKYITDKIMVMYLGNVMEVGNTKEIFEDPKHPYTEALFSAVPVPNPDAKMNRIILEGDIPSPANPPKGCKFHTRCPKCTEACKALEPRRIQISEDHYVNCHLYDDEVNERYEKYLLDLEKVEADSKVEK